MDKKKAMIFAIIVAVIGVILVQLYIMGEKKKYTDETKLVKVIVAKKNIAAGTPIERSMLTVKKYFREFVPKDAVSVRDVTRILGVPPKVDIKKGEPILASHFREGGVAGLSTKFLSGAILPGERAITVRVDEESGVAGLIRPGDYVDILGTFTKIGGGVASQTVTILQSVPVLAIGSQVGTTLNKKNVRTGRSYRTITLSVTPEEAELIEFARRKTKLVFVLRNPEDTKTKEDIKKVSFSSIFSGDTLKQLQKKRNQMNKKRIEILK
ncbi:pilus assembly protein CpaB [Thermotomaculum hydrothermale]|uniref:Pilus assembly protein CpaB n=1 Tax=Thermotomaculum hydrothermale TaxID=981385 RepID=A0A7R6SY97_9BACT|nr:Flp pilus assembly protein CpaB [Thermotomaculum hydrothermale]BBB32326.1 pilus assembly protein CpaB [Thermotomaculum hydrothermale]